MMFLAFGYWGSFWPIWKHFYQQKGYVYHLAQFFLKTQQHKQMWCFITWVGCHIKGHAIHHEYAKTLIMLECTKITGGN
jgi:hypothetical protein